MIRGTVLDIETVADPNNPPILVESMTGKAKRKSPEDIIGEFPLSPLTGKIVCFASCGVIVDVDGSITITKPESIVSHDEIDVLNHISDKFSNLTQLDTIITFNGKSFDLPFIKVRCALAGIRIHHPFRETKYDMDGHFDVRMALTNFDQYGKGRLDEWALKFGITDSLNSENSVAELFEADNLEAIRLKCENDVNITAELFSKIFRYYL